jgi:hypothetical protein
LLFGAQRKNARMMRSGNEFMIWGEKMPNWLNPLSAESEADCHFKSCYVPKKVPQGDYPIQLHVNLTEIPAFGE